IAAGAALLWLPRAVAAGRIDSVWYVDLATASPGFAVAAFVLGALLLWPVRDDATNLRRLSAVSIVALALVYGLFAQTLWPRFDLAPAAHRIAALERAGVPLAHLDIYQNQFRFLGRLERPITAFLPGQGHDWAAAHPDGRVIRYVKTLSKDDLIDADLVQPFRSDWLVIERAGSWLARERGEAIAPPATPAELFPHGYWPYRALGVDAR
ncbi:MAG: glycosyl transferase, partial [Xanthomonadales bacterium]|nr:glycosyl transferase [Xanthomonadales bacterium]